MEYFRKGAEISECGQYRYALFRHWDESLPQCEFIMLNPSTADEDEDDATIRRCVAFADSWGCGSLKVMNLFAFRAKDPRRLKLADKPIGPNNNFWLKGCPSICEPYIRPKHIICAWGNHGKFMERSDAVFKILKDQASFVECLEQNVTGEPKHPLYSDSSLMPKQYVRSIGYGEPGAS